jgi:alpha-glucosidase (family GH31 glycosyl hydrolase)
MRHVLVSGLAAVAAAVTLATPAVADVRIGDRQIVVDGPGARAVIDRSPFRVSYQDDAGRPVLRQVENTAPAPFPVAAVSPEPFSYGKLDRNTLYAPLTFTVGGSRTIQPCPGNVCGGNQLTGFDAGVEYTPREVIAAKPDGDGVRLTLSTNDPSGRTLVVTVTPGPGRALRMRAVPVPATGVAMMADSFVSRPGEAFRGFGGRHNAIDQRGEAFYTWPEQENSYNAGGAAYSGRDDYQYPNGPHAAYYPQALFYSSEPYGFLLNQTHLSFFRMAADREDAWNVSAVGGELDYVVAPGPAKRAIRTITALNGRHRMPPAWSIGPMTTNWRPLAKAEKLATGVDTYEQAVRQDIAMIKKHDVPIESYDLFGWAFFDQATLKDILAEFRARDIRVLSYFQAFVDDNTHGFSEAGMYDEAIRKGYAVKTAAGTPYVISSPLMAGLAVMIDFTNPAAVRWWKERIHRNLDLGFDGFMEDFGEQISLDMHFHNGETGATMHNKYPNLYHAATRAAIEEYEREHPGREIWNYTRAGYSGTTEVKGSAWGEMANFPGDNTADWTQASGLKSAAVDMLSRGVGGAWGFSTDIGGYLGDTPKELFYRWTQWAALSPYFRLHNSSSSGTRQPWFYDEGPTVAMFNRYARLHQRARPLILRLARQAQRTGIPPARPMWLEFPGDAEAAKQEQQWMLGPDVLVAPVVDEGATKKQVYFPAGAWTQPDTGRTFRGPATVEVPAPLEQLPWFVRAGSKPFRGR